MYSGPLHTDRRYTRFCLVFSASELSSKLSYVLTHIQFRSIFFVGFSGRKYPGEKTLEGRFFCWYAAIRCVWAYRSWSNLYHVSCRLFPPIITKHLKVPLPPVSQQSLLLISCHKYTPHVIGQLSSANSTRVMPVAANQWGAPLIGGSKEEKRLRPLFFFPVNVTHSYPLWNQELAGWD